MNQARFRNTVTLCLRHMLYRDNKLDALMIWTNNFHQGNLAMALIIIILISPQGLHLACALLIWNAGLYYTFIRKKCCLNSKSSEITGLYGCFCSDLTRGRPQSNNVWPWKLDRKSVTIIKKLFIALNNIDWKILNKSLIETAKANRGPWHRRN